MLSRTRKPLARGLVAAALFASGAAHANLVTNGGFETGDFTGWTTSLDPAFDGVDVLAPQAGTYAAFFGGAKSSISQTLATVAGGKYTVSFWLQLESDVNGAAAPNAFSFDFGPSSGTSMVDASAFGYGLYEVSFIAASASTDLTFRFSQGPAFWDLDSVQVNLPEPGSLALLAAAGLGAFGARRRRSASQEA